MGLSIDLFNKIEMQQSHQYGLVVSGVSSYFVDTDLYNL